MEKIPSTSQPKSQNSHMAEKARVLLYWGGEIIYGPNGVSYNAIPKRFVRVDSKISLKEFISLMYRTTGINCSQYKLKLISRYPMSFSSSVTYQGVPVEDDGDLHDVLCIPKNFPSLSTVEIYILQKDAQLSSGSVDNQTIVPNTIVGSCTQMLNDGSRAEIVGNERLDYGAFIAGSTRDVHRRNDRNMHGSSTSQMSCTLELESNKKFCEHDHYSTPRTSNCTPACSASNGMDNVTIDPVDAIVENDVNVVTPLVDSHRLDQAQSDEKDTDVHVETVLEDDCAHIPFYSDIGDVRDSLIDQFDHQRRPIWENDHNSELQLGIIFKSKEGVQHAVKMWSIRKRMHFKVYESTPTSWFVRCEYYKDKNCKWNVRAKQKKKHNFFEITKLNIRHTCVPDIQTENHANLDCNMVGRLVQNHVKENPSYKVCDVAEEVKNLPGDTTSVLEDWWQQHSKWPYPTEDVKEKLVEETGLQLKQINNWFINQRKRNWQSNSQSVTSLKSKRKR